MDEQRLGKDVVSPSLTSACLVGGGLFEGVLIGDSWLMTSWVENYWL